MMVFLDGWTCTDNQFSCEDKNDGNGDDNDGCTKLAYVCDGNQTCKNSGADEKNCGELFFKCLYSEELISLSIAIMKEIY